MTKTWTDTVGGTRSWTDETGSAQGTHPTLPTRPSVKRFGPITSMSGPDEKFTCVKDRGGTYKTQSSRRSRFEFLLTWSIGRSCENQKSKTGTSFFLKQGSLERHRPGVETFVHLSVHLPGVESKISGDKCKVLAGQYP